MARPKYLGDIIYGGRRMAWGKGTSANGVTYLSGVEGSDPQTGEFPGEIGRQTQLALDKARDRLVEAGSDFEHVVRVVAYVVGRENVDPFRAARESWVRANLPGMQVPPYASTLLVVAGLARPEMLVEIDVTAVAAARRRAVRRRRS